MAVNPGEGTDVARIREAAASFHAEVIETLGLSDSDSLARSVCLAALIDQHTGGQRPESGSFVIHLSAEGENQSPRWLLDPGMGARTHSSFLELFVSGI